jgi:hypothetical protein
MPTNYVMVDFENTQPDSLDELPVGAFKIKVFVGASQAKARVAMRFSMSMQRHGAHAQYVEMTRSGPNAMDMHIAYFLGQLLAAEPDASVYIVSKDKDFDPLIEFLDKHGGHCARVKSIGELMKLSSAAKSATNARQPPVAKPVAPRPRAAKAPPPKSAPARGSAPRPAARPAAPPAAPRPAAKPGAAPPAPRLAAPKSAAPAATATATPRRSAAGDLEAIVKQLRAMSGKPASRKSLAQTIGSYFRHHGGERAEREVEQTIDELLQHGFIKQEGAKIRYLLG